MGTLPSLFVSHSFYLYANMRLRAGRKVNHGGAYLNLEFPEVMWFQPSGTGFPQGHFSLFSANPWAKSDPCGFDPPFRVLAGKASWACAPSACPRLKGDLSEGSFQLLAEDPSGYQSAFGLSASQAPTREA